MAKNPPSELRRDFKPSHIAILANQRLTRNYSWERLVDEFMKLQDDGYSEGPPDWRTLRKAILDDSDWGDLVPVRVANNLRMKVLEEFRKVDLGAMLLEVMLTRYSEWAILRDRWLRSNLTLDDEERVEFTAREKKRFDELSKEIMGNLKELFDMMGRYGAMGRALQDLLSGVELTVGDGPRVIDSQESLASARDVSAQLLEQINARHREEGKGHYRAMPAVSEADFLEEDI